jgi:hypothetical protein
VERGEPIIEFYAVARKSIRRISRWLAPRASRVARAGLKDVYAVGEVGKFADLTVLSKDIMKIPAPEILTTTCAMTVVGGEIVYEAGK